MSAVASWVKLAARSLSRDAVERFGDLSWRTSKSVSDSECSVDIDSSERFERLYTGDISNRRTAG